MCIRVEGNPSKFQRRHCFLGNRLQTKNESDTLQTLKRVCRNAVKHLMIHLPSHTHTLTDPMHPCTHTHEQTAVGIYSARAWFIFYIKKKNSKGSNCVTCPLKKKKSHLNIAGQQKHMNESFRVAFWVCNNYSTILELIFYSVVVQLFAHISNSLS